MADIPDGVDLTTARAALAWEIVKASYLKFAIDPDRDSVDQYLDKVINAYIKAYNAVIKSEPIKST